MARSTHQFVHLRLEFDSLVRRLRRTRDPESKDRLLLQMSQVWAHAHSLISYRSYPAPKLYWQHYLPRP